MTSSSPSHTPTILPTMAQEPTETGQPAEYFEPVRSVRAKRKEEEASSSVPERKQQVMTESQLAML